MRALQVVTMIAVMGALASPSAGASAELANFQGLNGRSRESNFLTRFPQAKPDSICRPGETVSKSADGFSQCTYYKIDRYGVGEVNFDMLAFFYPSGTLKSIYLTDGYGFPYQTERTIESSEIWRKHKVLLDLLSLKYGPRKSNDNSYEQSASAVWFFDYWTLNGMTIKLSSFFTRRKSDGPWEGKISLEYGFVEESQASKL